MKSKKAVLTHTEAEDTEADLEAFDKAQKRLLASAQRKKRIRVEGST